MGFPSGLLAIGAALVAVTAVTLGGCSFYNREYKTENIDSNPYDLKLVQFDDFGSFWDANKANETLRQVDEAARSGNTLVVVFIHGWHHNASGDDPNLLDFKLTLDKLSAALRTPERNALRKQLTGSSELRIMGVFMGWRGRSLPGDLDYATMWWRKSAAERVGDGDAAEFIERLDRIYLRQNAHPANGESVQTKSIMGLVTIGHSFGGQVLLRAIARSLEYSLAERAPCIANVLKPGTHTPRSTVDEHSPVDSLGDLNILVNPATEAYQFGRIDALYRQLDFPATQTPQLVVFSADNDVPRKFFFPIARAITRPFRPGFRDDNDGYQGQLWGKALGELPQQQTHDLNLTSNSDSLIDADYASNGDGEKVRDFDFTSDLAFKGVELTPVTAGVPGSPGRIPNSPVVVAVSHSSKIIDGHNGIFGCVFRNFLVEYVAFIEGKRALLRAQRNVQLRSTSLAPHAPVETAVTCENP
ncbi:hypothetical protein [Paraburkholderia bannensis]|uniref:hypothetical protein n=1 Tax=Paraburkholderia bannensis TaxID=765414 RepID=UPI002ABE769E|nr:hypothetical protein [Paraburkholderia bannensis]